MPFYLEKFLQIENAGSFGAIRVIRLTRVARVLKMSRYSSAIQIFVQAIAVSMKTLSMLLFLMAIAMIVFSSAIYFAEYTPDGCRNGGWLGNCTVDSDGSITGDFASSPAGASAKRAADPQECICVDPNPYHSIAASFWWSIVTMSTVGYGDMTPVTVIGKMIGSATILTGMLVLALPITVIGTNFQKVMKTVVQQTMKTNVEYLQGRRQIAREEIQAILQRFHAVTEDIHLDIDDIIAVYDTDNSGTLEDDELARFRHDLEVLQNRAFLNQHFGGNPPTSSTALTPMIPQFRGEPVSSRIPGGIIEEGSCERSIKESNGRGDDSHNMRQTIAVTRAAKLEAPVAVAIRPSRSHPHSIQATAGPDEGSLERAGDVSTESTAVHHLISADTHSSTPISGFHQQPVSPTAALVAVPLPPSTQSFLSTPHHVLQSMIPLGFSRSESPMHNHAQGRSANVPLEDMLVLRLAEMQRAWDTRLRETEARLEAKLLTISKILLRIENRMEMDD
ncbi:hypothetical protein PINS_up011244 [Pythium insidiosum]|nr:hypothetical protein PINS_up011244 [Pythium insidiosum]